MQAPQYPRGVGGTALCQGLAVFPKGWGGGGGRDPAAAGLTFADKPGALRP